MGKIFHIVEGATEERFFKEQLQQHYVEPNGTYRHYFRVVQMPSIKNAYSRKNKGGVISFALTVTQIRRFINGASDHDLFILSFDYYGLDHTFLEGISPDTSLSDQVAAIQSRLEEEINDYRFKFRLQVHEFEALLFSDTQVITDHFNSPTAKSELDKALNQANNDPELVNNSRETAPSKRLTKIFPGYGKVSDGITIARKIGILNMRQKCKYFNSMCELIDGIA